MRVLVAEDDAKMARLIRRGLGERGVVVDLADSGEDVLWMAVATNYDAIVLDVMLPGIDASTRVGGCVRTTSAALC